MHNLRTVLVFEVVRTLKKPTFWAVTLGVPLLIVAISVLSALGGMQAGQTAAGAADEKVPFTYTDASGLVDEKVAADSGGSLVPDSAAAVEQVRTGASPAHFDYPADPAKEPIKVYSEDSGLMENSKYPGIAERVLRTSVRESLPTPELAAIAGGDLSTDAVAYRDGHATAGLRGMIVPGMFLILLFMSIVLLGNQLLTITLEEKENRVTEMVLTTMRPTTLIVGKIIGVVVLGIIQAAVFAAPGLLGLVVAWFVMRDNPQFQQFMPVVEPGPVIIGALLFLLGFLLFAGLLVCVGSVMPTAKEAGGVYAGVIIAMFLPLYAMSMVLSQPEGPVSRFFTFFPLTGPITALIRNASGTLPLWEAAVVLVLLAVFSAVFLWLGARLFQTGSLAYDTRLNLRKALSRRQVQQT